MPAQNNPNILLKPPIIEGNTEKMWLPVWKDREGNPIKNKAGVLPVKPNWELHCVARYDVEVYRASYTDQNFWNQFNAINQDTWRGIWTPGKAWIGNIHWEQVILGQAQQGFLVKYAIYCTDLYDGWKFCHPNVGYTYKDGTNQKAFLADGIPYIGNLDSAGASAADYAILTENTKYEINFTSSLGF